MRLPVPAGRRPQEDSLGLSDGEINAIRQRELSSSRRWTAGASPILPRSLPAGARMPRRQSCLWLRPEVWWPKRCGSGCCCGTPRPRRFAFVTCSWCPCSSPYRAMPAPSPSSSRWAATCRAGRAALAIATRSQGGADRWLQCPSECSPSKLDAVGRHSSPAAPCPPIAAAILSEPRGAPGRACRVTELRLAGIGDQVVVRSCGRIPSAHSRARLPHHLPSHGGCSSPARHPRPLLSPLRFLPSRRLRGRACLASARCLLGRLR